MLPSNSNRPLDPRCDFRSIFNEGAHENLVSFWSTFGTLFGTWGSQVAFFIVFLMYFFEARFFIDFGWPQGSQIDAFWGWPTWLKCGKYKSDLSFAGFYTRLVFGALQGTLQAHFLRSFWEPNPPLYALWGDFGSFGGSKMRVYFLIDF